MSMSNPHCIDIITSRPGSNEVQLIVADALDWSDPATHWRLLTDKLGGYATFVHAGGLAQLTDPPLPATPEVWIVVYALYPAPRELDPAFAEVAELLERFSIRFRHEHRPMPMGGPGGAMLQ